jgi:prolyl 4-hydroxylase
MELDVVVPGYGRPYLDGDSLDHTSPLVATIANVMSAAECASMVARIDALGPSAAPVTTRHGMVMRPDIRNNERVMFDDVALAAELHGRIAATLPGYLCGMTPVGANERFRGYRYTPGQRFAPHYDGAFVRNARERSLLTLIIYLDEGCAGGETNFLDFDLSVTPRRGMALLFQHRLLHEGAEVTGGVKYVLRSDVMYRD